MTTSAKETGFITKSCRAEAGYQWDMMEKVDWILPFTREGEDLHFHKAGKTLEEVMGKEPGEGILLSILQQIADLEDDLEKYLLDEEGILKDPKAIFYDEKDHRLRFCYVPGKGPEEEQQSVIGVLSESLWKISVEGAWIQTENIRLLHAFLRCAYLKKMGDREWRQPLHLLPNKEERIVIREYETLLAEKAGQEKYPESLPNQPAGDPLTPDGSAWGGRKKEKGSKRSVFRWKRM